MRQFAELKQMILDGEVGKAIDRARALCPDLLEQNKELALLLNCQYYVEIYAKANNVWVSFFFSSILLVFRGCLVMKRVCGRFISGRHSVPNGRIFFFKMGLLKIDQIKLFVEASTVLILDGRRLNVNFRSQFLLSLRVIQLVVCPQRKKLVQHKVVFQQSQVNRDVFCLTTDLIGNIFMILKRLELEMERDL